MSNNVKMCVQCGHYISKEAQFCPECGSNLKTYTDCPKCNEKLAKDAKFCNHCGTDVSSSNLPKEKMPKVVGWRGIVHRFMLLVCMACFLFPSAGAMYAYTQGKWTDDHLAIMGASLLPLITFLSLRWILRGAKVRK